MARERMVTRTVTVTVSEVMCLNITNAEVQIVSLELSGSYPDNDSILKALKKVHETDTFKCVAIQEVEEREILYGMKEIDFIKIARILPPRTKSANADSEDDDSIEE